MMTARKSSTPRRPSFGMGGDDLHQDPLVSAKGLLELLTGANPMSLTRWRKAQGMPDPVVHGKYSLPAMLKWVWTWKLQLDDEIESMNGSGERDEIQQELQKIKLARERLAWNLESKQYGPLQEWKDAESGRIQIAISILHTLPDLLIDEQLAPEAARTRMLERIGEAVDAIKAGVQDPGAEMLPLDLTAPPQKDSEP